MRSPTVHLAEEATEAAQAEAARVPHEPGLEAGLPRGRVEHRRRDVPEPMTVLTCDPQPDTETQGEAVGWRKRLGAAAG